MDIVIIGSGNVAGILGRAIKNRTPHRIVQVVSRDEGHAQALAAVLGCASGTLAAIDKTAQLYLLCIADAALEKIHEKVQLGSRLVVHTAGAVPMQLLSNISSNFGVFYPLQSLRMETADIPPIPFLIDGNTPETVALLLGLANEIGESATHATDAQRLKLHVAGTVVNNFTNHLYVLAEAFCEKEGVDFKQLLPLIQETGNRMDTRSPSVLQTGPAIRNDVFTLEKHIKALASHAKLKYLYIKFTDSLMSLR